MTRPKIIDTFMWNNEADILECRFETMDSCVDWFVLIEADVDHQDHPKPYHFAAHAERFKRWQDKTIVVQASGLPHTDHNIDPWSREWAQRDWAWKGIEQVPGLQPSDVVLHGDVDELCRPLFVRNVRPKAREIVCFGQVMYCFAVDWQHPDMWGGTVAATVETLRALGPRNVDTEDDVAWNCGAFQLARNQRNGFIPHNFRHKGPGWKARVLLYSGWHFSWLGGPEANRAKLGSFCHPEIEARAKVGLDQNRYMTEGVHVDGVHMSPVDVDATWPAYIVERRCPESWWRPR